MSDRVSPVLRFRGVHLSHVTRLGLWRRRAVRALRDVSFDLRHGEILGVVGESGSGKSTLGRLAVRLLQPDAGSIEFEGEDLQLLRRRDDAALCRRLQMVFQDPESALDPRMTIACSLREPLDIHRIGKPALRAARVRELLARVGLPEDLLARHPHELSGGQKQRVAIARALALGPQVLVADEALGALDASVKSRIVRLLLDLREQLGLSILFISHDLPLVQAMCDRVLVLYRGELMELAPAAELDHGGRHPYTQALWRSSPLADPSQRLLETRTLAEDRPRGPMSMGGCAFHPRCAHASMRCVQTVPAAFVPAPDVVVRCWLHDGDDTVPVLFNSPSALDARTGVARERDGR